MDKFGIFKLLNSFLGNSSNTQGENMSQKDDNNEKNNNGLMDVLSALSPALNTNKKENPNTLAPPPHTSIPLQAGMLNTIKSHDDFVKRVKEKNKV